MNLKKIIIVGVLSLTVFTLGIIWAYFLMVDRRQEIEGKGKASVPSEIGKAEIGIVDQVLFSTDRRLQDWRAARQKRLGSYGWIDKAKGIAHIPIEQAMERVVAAPPDIAGEGVPPAAAAPRVPAAATVEPAAQTGGKK